jgi:hypothetical protein
VNRGRRDDERGFALILGALLLVLMMLFAAFAIDFGALYNHRRADQNAADSGSLAAAQDLGAPVATMVATAKSYVETTLGVTFSAAQWNSCGSDGGSLANLAPGSNCISYTTDQVRVRVPDQQYETFFAGIAGVDTFRHSAFAVAGLVPEGFGGVLPFGVTGTSAQGGFGCLQSDSNGQASAVCGSTSGNFDYLDFGQFGSALVGTTNNCGNGTQDDRLRENMAMGVDHTLSRFGTVYSTEVIDTVACAPPQTPSPNAVMTRTGNQTNDATVGLMTGTSGTFPDGDPARLARHNSNLFGGSGPTPIDVLGSQDLDNVPLWDFIPANYGPGEATPADIPSSCRRREFVDGSGNFSIANTPLTVQTYLGGRSQGDQSIALLERCIAHYRGLSWTGSPVGVMSVPEPPTGCIGACNDPVFARNTSTSDDPDLFDIQYTSRFGYVPELDNFGSGTNPARIMSFKAVFIQRLKIERSGSNSDVIWDPGVFPQPPTSGGHQGVGETSIFVFPSGILPNNLSNGDAPFEIGVNRFVRLLR